MKKCTETTQHRGSYRPRAEREAAPSANLSAGSAETAARTRTDSESGRSGTRAGLLARHLGPSQTISIKTGKKGIKIIAAITQILCSNLFRGNKQRKRNHYVYSIEDVVPTPTRNNKTALKGRRQQGRRLCSRVKTAATEIQCLKRNWKEKNNGRYYLIYIVLTF